MSADSKPSPIDQPKNRPRIGILFFETYLGCAPSIINAARRLAETGFDVEILIRGSAESYVAPPDLGNAVTVIVVGGSQNEHQPCDNATPRRSRLGWLKERLPNNVRTGLASKLQTIRNWREAMRPSRFLQGQMFSESVLEATKNRQYDCLIGADTHGLIAAHRVANKQKIPVVFWSLEIMFLRDFWNPILRRAKRLERHYHRSSLALIIQDEERQKALCDENKAWKCPTLLVPNSPRGFLADGLSGNYFHKKFNLPATTKVILHAGSVCEGMRSSDLARAASEWPEDYRLVFHSHTHLDPQSAYAQSLLNLGGGRVLLSTDPVSYDDLDAVMMSASVGLVIYDGSLGPNFRLLAGASGKLAHSLKCGVPVISIQNPSIGRVLAKHQCGIGVDSPFQVLDAIEQILFDLESYKTRSFRCYADAYEFDTHFAPVVTLLAQTISSRTRPDPGSSGDRRE
jgi:hypothetical protein